MKVTREYTCTYCHHDFTGHERKEDEPIQHCPACEKQAVNMTKEMGEEGCI